MDLKIVESDLPGLYHAASSASVQEQGIYFKGIFFYIFILIIASTFAFYSDSEASAILKIISAMLFLSSLSIMIWLRVSKPDSVWYNGRAVAESVKTRAWRWMLRAEPYEDIEDIEIMRKKFISDLKAILEQNKSLIGRLGVTTAVEAPISQLMMKVRGLSIDDRLNVYRKERIRNQALWYFKKSKFNKKRSRIWFLITIILHAAAIACLLYNIKEPKLKLPIEIIAVAASGVLTWLQAKKHNELSFSYSLTAHEISLIESETTRINTETELSDYVMNCENAFSREHTQWVARKNE